MTVLLFKNSTIAPSATHKFTHGLKDNSLLFSIQQKPIFKDLPDGSHQNQIHSHLYLKIGGIIVYEKDDFL